MPIKALALSIGFLISWLVFLPVLLIGGGMALLAGATLAEIGAKITGSSPQGLSAPRARQIAHAMCGYAPARIASHR